MSTKLHKKTHVPNKNLSHQGETSVFTILQHGMAADQSSLDFSQLPAALQSHEAWGNIAGLRAADTLRDASVRDV